MDKVMGTDEKKEGNGVVPETERVSITSDIIRKSSIGDDDSIKAERGGFFKWSLLFFTLCAISVTANFILVLSVKEWDFHHILFIPIFLTTLSSIIAVLALFNTFIHTKKIIFFAIFSLIVNLVSVIYTFTLPGIFSNGIYPLIVLFNFEPPFFVPLLLYNVYIVLALIFWKPIKPSDIAGMI